MRNLEIKNIDCHAALAMTKNAQSGRSMIEMLGVLAIIGVLSVGGIAGYSKAMQKYRVNKAIEQITLIAGNVRAFWGPQKNYIGVRCCSCRADGCTGQTFKDGCPIIKKAKILPDEMITLDSTGKLITSITNPFGGVVELYTENKTTDNDNQAFSIRYQLDGNIEACIELLTHDWTNAGASIVGTSSDNVFYVRPPVNLDDAITMCEDDPALINIDFRFDVDVNSALWQPSLSDCSIANGGC